MKNLAILFLVAGIQLRVYAQTNSSVSNDAFNAKLLTGSYVFENNGGVIRKIVFYPKSDGTRGVFEVRDVGEKNLVGGVYNLNQDEITLTDTIGRAMCPQPARYRLISRGQSLNFNVINDVCEGRYRTFDKAILTKQQK